MYRTRNTGKGNGMQGMVGMLYSGECRQAFRGMLLNVLGNVLKHSGECRQTFRGMSSNIPGDVAKHSGLAEHSGLTKHSGECPIYFDGRESVEASSITNWSKLHPFP